MSEIAVENVSARALAPAAAGDAPSRRLRSYPDYRYPAEWLGRRFAPLRTLAATVFHVARIAGKIAGAIAPITRQSSSAATIAIIRTDGVGDAILFEPTLRKLARRFDDCEIHLWAPPLVARMFEAHPSIKRIVCVPRGFKEGNLFVFRSLTWRAKLGWALGRFRYDLAMYAPRDPEPLGNWLLASMRSPERWITPGSMLNQFAEQRADAHTRATRVVEIEEPADLHELQRNERFAAAAWDDTMRSGNAKNRPEIHASARATTYAGVQLGAGRHAVRRARAKVLIGIVTAGSASINQYPPQKWADVIRILWDEHGLLCAMLGTADDAPIFESIDRYLADESTAERTIPLHRFASDLDIAVAAAVVAKLDGLVSVDTGLAHAAAAMDVPSAVIVTGGMPGRFFPWPTPTRSIALTRRTPCAGCNYRCTQTEPTCITEIEPQQIVDALLRAMKTTKGEHATLPTPKRLRNAG